MITGITLGIYLLICLVCLFVEWIIRKWRDYKGICRECGGNGTNCFWCGDWRPGGLDADEALKYKKEQWRKLRNK